MVTYCGCDFMKFISPLVLFLPLYEVWKSFDLTTSSESLTRPFAEVIKDIGRGGGALTTIPFVL